MVAGLGRGHSGEQTEEAVAILIAVSGLCVWFPVMTECAGLVPSLSATSGHCLLLFWEFWESHKSEKSMTIKKNLLHITIFSILLYSILSYAVDIMRDESSTFKITYNNYIKV